MRRRAGWTLVEVAIAAVVLTVGVLLTSRFFTSIHAQVAPTGPDGGLRAHLLAESMLLAQAEGLRALRTISPVAASNRLVKEAPGAPCRLVITQTHEPVTERYRTDGAAAGLQLEYFELSVEKDGVPIGSLSLSTLRAGGQDEKIGL